MSLRIKLIQFLIDINEKLIFYPRLSNYYRKHVEVKKPVIFDVGANKGQTISFFLNLFPEAKIFAFKPNPRLYQVLKKKFGHLENVKLINKGVSNQSGKLLLKETVTDETSTFEELNYDSDYLKMKAKVLGVKPEEVVAASYEVDVITLNAFIKEESLDFIDVVKIDTEGHELKCLEGLFEGNTATIQFIQLEQHHDDMYLKAVKAEEIDLLLQNSGFVISAKIKHGFGDFEELMFKRI
ncbi:FkbM family methyltransferase [Lacibacter sp. H407]|uniref:FkbM family methyltransferase n=1 Tax=Lacibacter sp. H407 TaxID=3133423 RepID=UPI0030C4439D